MAHLHAIPRSSFAIVFAALILASAILVNTFYTARGENHDQTFYACLYAGSLSQVNTDGPPANCGRGTQVEWTSETGVTGLTTVIPRRSGPVTIAAGDADIASASCDAGEIATGGGYTAGREMTIFTDAPNVSGRPADAWIVAGFNASTAPGDLVAYVLCASTGVAEP